MKYRRGHILYIGIERRGCVKEGHGEETADWLSDTVYKYQMAASLKVTYINSFLMHTESEREREGGRNKESQMCIV